MSHEFFTLTPERVLESVERSGLLCTGRCSALNSFENRVYDVELEEEQPGGVVLEAASRRRIAKFYRPGRWTKEQILEEHQFLFDLQAEEIPAIAPLCFFDGESLKETPEGILFSLFPRVGGRAPDELSNEQHQSIGRLLARIHNVGARRETKHRVKLTSETMGKAPLELLLAKGVIPMEYLRRYEDTAREIIRIAAEQLDLFKKPVQLHGDCHLGNLLWSANSPFFLDFDDSMVGPPVQDVWLLLGGRPSEDDVVRRQLDNLLAGYEEMREFDYSTLKLIELLRALRFIHYSGWIAKRWEDPAFPAAFPEFGGHRYWADETSDLEQQLQTLSRL